MPDDSESRWAHYGSTDTDQDTDGVEPDVDDLIKGYIQYSEESRYRDGIMHNSYYFVLFAVAIFTGHIVSLDLRTFEIWSLKSGILFLSVGLVLLGISVVMKTYNRKRINAEDRRYVIENILDETFSKSGIFQIEDNEQFDPREEDNPFAIQENVIHRNKKTVENLVQNEFNIGWLAKLSIWFGIVTIGFGAGIVLANLI
ncbi:hypothetical protein [Haloarcula sp. K1]|uniref:hypothetical protein n=1 Tax=Haloarcula sp. K1 TaxID=1622207 RepID=UPI0007BB5CCB|nr:hypothetical protein [Haloarcula sp. K1]KZX49314.1 hypothetical protein AV929_12280 [Haloarcula sp. K1]